MMGIGIVIGVMVTLFIQFFWMIGCDNLKKFIVKTVKENKDESEKEV